jgi:hypothetical protein
MRLPPDATLMVSRSAWHLPLHALALGLYGSLSINFNYLALALTDASCVAGLVRSKSRSEITESTIAVSRLACRAVWAS